MNRIANQRSRETPPPFGRASARRGVSLIEVLVSVLMIAVALGGVMGSAGAVARQMGGGMRMTVAASLAQTRLDSLASLSCAQLVHGLTGTAITRGISQTWGVTDGRNIKTLTVTLTIPRKVQRPSYSTVIPCRD